MEQNPCWEVHSHSASQEFLCLLWNRRFITVFTADRHWTLSLSLSRCSLQLLNLFPLQLLYLVQFPPLHIITSTVNECDLLFLKVTLSNWSSPGSIYRDRVSRVFISTTCISLKWIDIQEKAYLTNAMERDTPWEDDSYSADQKFRAS